MNKYMRYILYILLILGAKKSYSAELSPLDDLDAVDSNGCISQQIIDDIRNDFTFVDYDKWATNRCDKDNIVNRVIRGLYFLKYQNFDRSTASHDEMFANKIGADYPPYQFVRDRIKKIDFTKDGCEGNWIAYAYKFSSKFTVCAKLSANNLSLLEYSATAVHEARHTDASDKGHFNCSHGLNVGTQNCDQNVRQQGGYFYNLEYHTLLARAGQKLQPALKDLTRSNAIQYRLNSFNEIPIAHIENSSLVIDGDNQLQYLNSDFHIAPTNTTIDGLLFDSHDGNFLYLPDGLNFKNYSIYDGMGPISVSSSAGSFAKSYNEISSNSRGYVLDISTGTQYGFGELYNFGIMVTLLNKKKNKFINKMFSYPRVFTAKQFIKPSMCPNSSEKNIYIKDNDEKFYEISMDENSDSISYSEIQGCQKWFKNIVTLGNRTVGLTEDGRLLEEIGDKWYRIEGLAGKQYKYLSDPIDLYSSFLPNN